MSRVVVFVLLALCCSAAFAAPNLNAQSGYVQLPDATVTPAGEVDLSVAYLRTSQTNDLAKMVDPDLSGVGESWDGRVVTGIGNRVEIGGSFLNARNDAGDTNSWNAAAKVKVYEKDGLTVALGASYRKFDSDIELQGDFFPGPAIDVEVDMPTVTSVYLVMDSCWKTSPDSAWNWKASYGVMWDRYTATEQKIEITDPMDGTIVVSAGIPSEEFFRPIIGASVTNGDWTFMTEYKTKETQDGVIYSSAVWSAAVRKQLSDNLAITAGTTNFNLPYSDSKQGVFADLTYSFGK